MSTGMALVDAAHLRYQRLPYFCKYRSLGDDTQRKRFEEFFAGDSLWLCALKKLNDPFEGHAPYIFTADEATVRKAWQDGPNSHDPNSLDLMLKARTDTALQQTLRKRWEAITAEFGVFCMSESERDIGMWAYYADGHQGVCLKFDPVELQKAFLANGRGLLIPVDYRDAYPTTNYYATDHTAKVWLICGTKGATWKHEQEWRIVVTDEPAGAVRCPKTCLSAVVFGCRTPEPIRDWVANLIRIHRPQVRLEEAVKSESNYAIEIRPLA